MFVSFYGCSSNRDNPVQGVWGQEQWRALWRDHLRRLQGLLQAVAVVGRQLSMSAKQELRGRPCKQKPVPVLSVAKVPTPRHVKRWWVLSTNLSTPSFRKARIVLLSARSFERRRRHFLTFFFEVFNLLYLRYISSSKINDIFCTCKNLFLRNISQKCHFCRLENYGLNNVRSCICLARRA